MYPNPDFSDRAGARQLAGRRLFKQAGALAGAALTLLLSSACSSPLTERGSAQANVPVLAPVKVPMLTEASPPALPPLPAAAAPNPLASEPTLRLLAYAERVRQMQGPELSQEISRQAESSNPVAQLQLSLALSQLRQLPELLRAQELLARVLANPEAAPLHPLARLLASRYVEQRRLEEQIERQAQQLRDTQRRLEQTNDRLEALKAIERSLVSRPAGAASAPTGPARNRSAP